MSYMRILIFVLSLLMPLTACNRSENSRTPEEARIALGQMNIQYTPQEFVESAKRGDIVAVKLFLESGMDVNAGRGAALFLASAEGQLEVVKLLLNRGADVNAKTTGNGETALMAAVRHLDVVKLLLSKEADVNAKTSNGQTALRLASNENHSEVVRVLKAAGATE